MAAESKHPSHPCANCPYRKDAPLAYWDKSHYLSVAEGEVDGLAGQVFACHGHIKLKPKDRGFCAGWLLDQKERGVPSIPLRLMLHADDEALAAFKTVKSTVPMFKTAMDMVKANLSAIAKGINPHKKKKTRASGQRSA